MISPNERLQTISRKPIRNLLAIIFLMNGLTICVQVSFSQQLDEIGSVRIDDALKVFASGDYVYVSEDLVGLHVVDISDPEDPEIVGEYDDAGGSSMGIFYGDDIVYMANNQNGLYLIDVSDPENPVELENIRFQSSVSGVFVIDETAYVANREGGLIVLDVSDPENPEVLGTHNTDEEAVGVAVQGDYAYVADNQGGLIVIDVSDPEDPVEVGSTNDIDIAYRVAVQGDYAYVTDNDNEEFHVVDISDPEDPDRVGSCDTRGDNYDVAVAGDHAFVAYRRGWWTNGGVQVIDITDPDNPDPVDIDDFNRRCYGVSVTGTLLALAAYGEGLRIYDASDFIHLGPIIEVSVMEIDFLRVAIDSSQNRNLIIENVGNEDLIISEITTDDEFFTSDFDEEIILEPEENVELTITFTPELGGEFEAEMTIFSNDSDNGELEVSLIGAGVGAVIELDRDSYDFGSVGVGLEEEFDLEISNTGLLDLTITDVSIDNEVFSSDFAEQFVIEPGDNSEITVYYSPDERRPHEGVMIISSSDEDNDQFEVELSGEGVGAILAVEPDTLDFGNVGIHRLGEETVTVGNDGLLNLTLENIYTESARFDLEFNQEVVLEPGDELHLPVSFLPVEAREHTGILLILSDDPVNDEFVLRMTGRGIGPRISLNTDHLDFGETTVDNSGSRSILVTAEGLADLTVTGMSVEGVDFSVEFEDETLVELGSTISFDVICTPTTDGDLMGALTIFSDDADNPEVSVNLNAVGLRGNRFNTWNHANDITVSGRYAYIADGSAGVTLMDVSDPNTPDSIATLPTEGIISAVALRGGTVLVADSLGEFLIADFSNPRDVETIGEVNISGTPNDIFASWETAFIAAGDEGLIIIDIYDLERPTVIGQYDSPGYARAVTVVSNNAFIADDDAGLRIVDISNPEHPAEIGSIDTRGWSYDIAVSGELLYLADERRGLRIVDISDVEFPQEVGSFDTPDNAYGVSMLGDLAYVADGDGGLQIVNVSNPDEPFLVDEFYVPGNAKKILISDENGYICLGGDGVMISDIADYVTVKLDIEELPQFFYVSSPYPNPFNSEFTLKYGLPITSNLSLRLFDINGRELWSHFEQFKQPGVHSLSFQTDNFAAGTYLLQLDAAGNTSTQKVVLIK